MKRLSLTYKTRLLLTAGALFVFSGVPARAQTQMETSQLMNRINELENQVQTLSRAVYKGDKGAAAAMANSVSSADATAAANNDARMTAIEDKQRELTGQLEKISFDLQQIKDRVDKMQGDNEQRFQQMEHNASAQPQPSSVVAPAPAPAPAASGGAAPQGETLGTVSDSHAGPAEQLYGEAFADVRDSKYDEAEAKLKQFISQYPGHALTPNAQYWLGETYYVREDYKKAAQTFAQGYQSYPKSAKAEDSLYKLALSLAKMDKKDDACVSLRQLQKDFPGDTGKLHAKAVDEIKQLGCP
jgi:tol-pal system protein YbgF